MSRLGGKRSLRITAAANSGPPTAFSCRPQPGRFDSADGGYYRIVITVDEQGVVGPYPLRLFDRRSGRLVRSAWAGADGVCVFENIAYRLQGYFAIAMDHGADPENAAIADLITPELMP